MLNILAIYMEYRGKSDIFAVNKKNNMKRYTFIEKWGKETFLIKALYNKGISLDLYVSNQFTKKHFADRCAAAILIANIYPLDWKQIMTVSRSISIKNEKTANAIEAILENYQINEGKQLSLKL